MRRLIIVLLSLTPVISGNLLAAKNADSKTASNKIDKTRQILSYGTLTGKARTEADKDFKDKYSHKKKYKLSYYDIYKEFVPKLGVKHIGAFLEKENPSCHGVAHTLGRVIGETLGDLNAGMQLCGNTCTYACVHGVYKVYFTKLGKNYHNHKAGQHGKHSHHQTSAPVKLSKKELKKFSRDINNACAKSRTVVEDFFRGNCAHGVGHAMAKIANDTRHATNYCKEFPGKAMRYYCETGVFMQLGTNIERRLFKGTTRRSEQIALALDFCGTKSNYPSSCLRFILSRNKSLGQIARFAVLCNQQKPYLRRHCFNAMGFYSRTYLSKNPREIRFACALGKTAIDNKACISGAAFMKKDQARRKDMEITCKYAGSKAKTAYCLSQLKQYYYNIDNKILNVIL